MAEDKSTLGLLAFLRKNTGGSGETGSYSDLTNKPKINSVTLSGNKSLADIGAVAAPSNPASGQFLKYNGSAWVASSLPVYDGSVI